MGPLELYALTLATTAAVEAPIVAAGCGRKDALPVILAVLCVNLASHPAATALVLFAGFGWLHVEALVVAFEATALCAVLDVRPGRACLCALFANAVTAGMAWSWPGA